LLEILFDGGGFAFFGDGLEVSHQAKSLLVVMEDIDEFVALDAVAPDGTEAIGGRIEARVSGTFSTPAH
jgi:hypothetical protein